MDLYTRDVFIILINQIAFSSLIFIWYILYSLGIIKSSPLFALLLTLLVNIIILSILIKKNKITKKNITRFIFILLIFKILPLISFFPNYLNFTFKDIFIIIYIYAIYIVAIIIIIEIFNIDIKLDKFIYDDSIGDNYDKTATTHIYDFIINKINQN